MTTKAAQLTKETARVELLRSVLSGPLTEEDALLWMVLLHTHEIHLRPEVLSNRGNGEQGEEIKVLPAETQRGAASAIAILWPDRTDTRANDVYWYHQYNTRTPYEVLDAVPYDQRTRLMELRYLLASDPRVAAVVEED
jgi:hypothetical protein